MNIQATSTARTRFKHTIRRCLNPGPEYEVENDQRSYQDVRVERYAMQRHAGAFGTIRDPVLPCSLHSDDKRLALWTILTQIGVRVRVNDGRQPPVRGKVEQPAGFRGIGEG